MKCNEMKAYIRHQGQTIEDLKKELVKTRARADAVHVVGNVKKVKTNNGKNDDTEPSDEEPVE